MRKIVVLAALMAMNVAHADLGLVFDKTRELYVLDYLQQEDKMPYELTQEGSSRTVYGNQPDCKTFGSRMLAKSQTPESMAIARINLANLWLGNVCDGVSDVKPNGREVITWLHEIARSGQYAENAVIRDPGEVARYAHSQLMQAYWFGGPGVKANHKKAFEYLKDRAKTFPELTSPYLAYAYQQGWGVRKNLKEANRWIDISAPGTDTKHGPPWVYPSAILHAQAMELGLGERKDEAHAMKDYQALSRVRNQSAQLRLGLMYLHGAGVAKDVCAAWRYFKFTDSRIPGGDYAKELFQKIEQTDNCSEQSERSVLTRSERALAVFDVVQPLSNRGVQIRYETRVAIRRTRDDMEAVFEQNKAPIYSVYSRALRDNPSLRVHMVLEVTITPDGDVSDCKIVSAEGSNPEFNQRIVQRIKRIKFPRYGTETMTITKPIDFFPAGL